MLERANANPVIPMTGFFRTPLKAGFVDPGQIKAIASEAIPMIALNGYSNMRV